MWLNASLLKQIKEKRSGLQKYKMLGTALAFKGYRECIKKYKRIIRATKIDHEKHMATESKRNPKKVFQNINSKMVRTEQVGPLKDEFGSLITNNTEMANVLNHFFLPVVYTKYRHLLERIVMLM